MIALLGAAWKLPLALDWPPVPDDLEGVSPLQATLRASWVLCIALSAAAVVWLLRLPWLWAAIGLWLVLAVQAADTAPWPSYDAAGQTALVLLWATLAWRDRSLTAAGAGALALTMLVGGLWAKAVAPPFTADLPEAFGRAFGVAGTIAVYAVPGAALVWLAHRLEKS